MNLLLLSKKKISHDGIAYVTGRQGEHLIDILKVKEGDQIRAGIDNLFVGNAIIQSIATTTTDIKESDFQRTSEFGHLEKQRKIIVGPVVKIQFLHNTQCPIFVPSIIQNEATTKLPLIEKPIIDLLLALPRPRVFERILQTAATLGVRRIIFTSTSRVEIAYFSSPKLSRDHIEECLRLGLEQASCDPFFPEVYIYASWKSTLTELTNKFHYDHLTHKIVFDPEKNVTLLDNSKLILPECTKTILLAFGPEGGYINNELNDLKSIGFQVCQLGHRILKVETALVTAMAQVNLLYRQTTPEYIENSQCWCTNTDKEAQININLPIRGQRFKKNEEHNI